MVHIRNLSLKSVFVLFVVICGVSSQVQAASSYPEILQKAESLGLAAHPTWLKLLHYGPDGKQSEILSDDFFLSPDGRNDPEAEMSATINAYLAPLPDDVNKHARCRFPARYFWISQYVPLPEYSMNDGGCARLEEWALFDKVSSVSVFLVSGYMGNPASTFGHALLKLNTDSGDDGSELFDLTLNYGALIPENESVLRYIAFGLFGGYEAGFSDRYYYTQDLVYSHTEFRDIWDYKLALSDFERKLLILHIWEIIGKKFKYYFLDENCVYRIAELLDMVIKERVLKNARYWYIPVELFHRLHEIDRVRRSVKGSVLIDSVRFIPSGQRTFYYQMSILNEDEKKAFDLIVHEGFNSHEEHLEGFDVKRKMRILDVLLAYQQYRLAAEKPDPSHELVENRKKVLLSRLLLPPAPKPAPKIRELVSPAAGHRPMEFGAGVAGDKRGDLYFRLNWSPFKKEFSGEDSMEMRELVILDVAVGLFNERRRVFLDKADLVRVGNFKFASIPDENEWSWKFRFGVDRVVRNDEDRYDGMASFGAGRIMKLNKRLALYGVIDLGVHTQKPLGRLRPHLGMMMDTGVLQASVYAGVETETCHGNFGEVFGGTLHYQLSDRYAFRVEASNESATEMSAGINSYW